MKSAKQKQPGRILLQGERRLDRDTSTTPSSHGVDNILFSEALSAEGALVFAKACKLGLEGIVSKRAGSRYRTGNSRQWLKSKNPTFVRG